MISTQELGEKIRKRRKELGLTQGALALSSGTGIRFIIELEKGKATCQIGKVLIVLHMLGIDLELKKRNKNALLELLNDQADLERDSLL